MRHLLFALLAMGSVPWSVFGQEPDRPLSLQADADGLSGLCAAFAGFDQDGDGLAEITALRELYAMAPARGERPSVLVLVEQRLLEQDREGALARALMQHRDDLAIAGRRSDLVAIELSTEGGHRDGRLLLAMRELLREWAGRVSDPRGVILVGHFPDAYLVRTCNWRKHEAARLRDAAGEELRFEKVRLLRSVPETVAQRCDLILGDLDGRWESVYHQAPTRLPTLTAAFPEGVPADGGVSRAWKRGSLSFTDFFHVDDGRCDVHEVLGEQGAVVGLFVRPLDFAADRECSELDRQRANVIARPELCVSRIDARGSALRPRDDLRGVEGGGLLDDEGRPRAVRFEGEAPAGASVWELDPELEMRLLLQYFQRNHRFRRGVPAAEYRPASLAHELGSGYSSIAAAAERWTPHDRARCDVHGRPSLNALLDWWQRPAVLRTLRAHSDARGSVFGRPRLDALHEALRGQVWAWTRKGSQLSPSLADAAGGGRAGYHLYRSLWEAGLNTGSGSLLLHTGCEAVSPPGAQKLPYQHPAYGVRQGAEALLFFTDVVALMGRAKVFYDEPRGFAATLAAGDTMGDAWGRYFELESQGPTWSRVGGDIGRKRSYFWSVLGDWTLGLPGPR